MASWIQEDAKPKVIFKTSFEDEELLTCRLCAVAFEDGSEVSGDVVVPSYVNGYRVAFAEPSLPAGLFYGKTKVTSVTYKSPTPEEFGWRTFNGCTNLSAVYFEGDAPTYWHYEAFGDERSFDNCPATVYVKPGSTGWNCEIPGQWPPHGKGSDYKVPIAYY